MATYTIKIVNNSTTNPTYVVFQQPPGGPENGETLHASQSVQSAQPATATIDFADRVGTTATVTQGPDGAWTVSYG